MRPFYYFSGDCGILTQHGQMASFFLFWGGGQQKVANDSRGHFENPAMFRHCSSSCSPFTVKPCGQGQQNLKVPKSHLSGRPVGPYHSRVPEDFPPGANTRSTAKMDSPKQNMGDQPFAGNLLWVGSKGDQTKSHQSWVQIPNPFDTNPKEYRASAKSP